MKLVFATNNPNKLKEIQAAVPESITILGLDAIGCYEDIPEDQDTIEGNSAQKVNYIKTHYGVDSFADDTGLLVEALNGAPGVYSARYAGPEKSSVNIRYLHEFPAIFSTKGNRGQARKRKRKCCLAWSLRIQHRPMKKRSMLTVTSEWLQISRQAFSIPGDQ